MCPSSSHDGAYLIAWPRGAPHRVARTGSSMRYTLVTGMQPAARNEVGLKKQLAETNRVLRRMDLLVKSDVATIRRSEELMRPFAGGIVHRHTETEFDIHPFFESMYADAKDLIAARKTIESWYRDARDLLSESPSSSTAEEAGKTTRGTKK